MIKNNKEKKKSQRNRAISSTTIFSCGVLVAIICLLGITVSAITVPLVTIFRTTTTTTVPIPMGPDNCSIFPPEDYVNPSLIRVQQIEDVDPGGQGGHCLCHNVDDNQLYSFHGEDAGNHVLRAYNVTGYPDEYTTLLFGPNLIPAATYGSGMGKIISCVYRPATQCFLTTDTTSENLFQTCLNGTTTIVGPFTHAYGFVVRGFAITEDDRFFVNNHFDDTFIELNPDTAAPIGSIIPYNYDILGGTVFSMTYSFFYKQFYLINRRMGTVRLAGLNINTGDITEGCETITDVAWSGGGALDNQGRVWIATGGDGDFQFHIYFSSHPPAPLFNPTFESPNPIRFENCLGLVEAEFSSNYTLLNPRLEGEACCNSNVNMCSISLFAQVDDAFIISTAAEAKKRNQQKKSTMTNMTESHMTAISASTVVYNVSMSHVNTSMAYSSTWNSTVDGAKKRNVDNAPPPWYRFEHVATTSTFSYLSSIQKNMPIRVSGSLSNRYTYMIGRTDVNAITLYENGVISDATTVTGGLGNPCVSHSGEYDIHFDHEVRRWIFVWSAEVDNICIRVTADDSYFSGMDTVFQWQFTGQTISKLSFGIWGDYYNMCWNDSTNYGTCYIVERQRILFGGGTPRVVQIPAPEAISTLNHPLTVSVHQQLGNNGPRGPVMQAFPCGIFTVISSDQGGIIDMRQCISVNFDTSTIMSQNVRTIVGVFNDGASGSCTALDQCIPNSLGLELDPNRYDVRTSYRHFPVQDLTSALGLEMMAVAHVVDADGTNNAKARWGEFIMQPDGSLVPVGDGMYIFDPFQGQRHVFDVNVAYTPSGMLALTYRPSNATNMYGQHMSMRLMSWEPGRLSNRQVLNAAQRNHQDDPITGLTQLEFSNTPHNDIYPQIDSKSAIATGYMFYNNNGGDIEQRNYGNEFNLVPSLITGGVRYVAVDGCRNTASCFNEYDIAQNNSWIPTP
jgi:hypothetical protein